MKNFKGVLGVGMGTPAMALLMLCLHCGSDDANNPNGPEQTGGAAGESGSNGGHAGNPDVGEAGTGDVTNQGGSPAGGESAGGTDATGGGAAGESAVAGAGGEAAVPVSGDHYGYVVDSLKMPTTPNQAKTVGFDIDGDGTADNHFGQAMATLATQGFDVNGSIAAGIEKGEAIILGDLQATALTSAKGAAFLTYFGTDPMPAACAAANDCGHHLDGLASFSVDSGPVGKACEGALTNGVFRCKGGSLPIRIQLATTSLEFTLNRARVELTTVTEAGFPAGRLGGVISEKDVNDHIYPAELAIIDAAVAQDCTGGVAPGCGCTAGTTGKTYLDLLDTTDDCAVSLAEVKANAAVGGLFAPDLDLDDDNTPESLSCAFTISGKHATFDLP